MSTQVTVFIAIVVIGILSLTAKNSEDIIINRQRQVKHEKFMENYADTDSLWKTFNSKSTKWTNTIAAPVDLIPIMTTANPDSAGY